MFHVKHYIIIVGHSIVVWKEQEILWRLEKDWEED